MTAKEKIAQRKLSMLELDEEINRRARHFSFLVFIYTCSPLPATRLPI